MRSSSWALSGCAVITFVTVVFACAEEPSIDGSRVPPIANPTCPQACDRLVQLCGYAPVDCVQGCTDGWGDEQRACVGGASSCQVALESCAPEETDGGEEADAEAEGGEADGGEEVDGSGDAGAVDDASDAASE